MRRLVTDEEVERARTCSRRTDTRAYFRGRVMEKFGSAVVAASWDSVIFDVPGRRRCSGCRCSTRSGAPRAGGCDHRR